MKKVTALMMMMVLLVTGQVTANAVVGAGEAEEAVPVLISEDEQLDTIMDGGVAPILYGNRNAHLAGCSVVIGEKAISFDKAPVVKENVLYLPLRYTLEGLGYEVTWNPDTQSVDIMKGAKFTSVYIGRNYYFKNRMAPVELSGAPFIVDGRTMLPVEFFYLMLDESFVIENGEVIFNSDMMGQFSGYIQTIEYDETGNATITISSEEVSKELWDQTIIHTNNSFTVFQKDITEGDFINVLTSPVMAMSIPGQTAGFAVY